MRVEMMNSYIELALGKPEKQGVSARKCAGRYSISVSSRN